MNINCFIQCGGCNSRDVCKYKGNFDHFASVLEEKIKKIEPDETFPMSTVTIGCKYYKFGFISCSPYIPTNSLTNNCCGGGI